MTTTAKRRAVLIGLTALAACTAVGCTPRREDTAMDNRRPPDRPDEGGVGGTGIVGILYGTGSLLVNGLRIETPSDVQVRDAFGPRRLDELALGQSLTVEAATGADGTLIARSITANHPLIGPIEALTGDGFRCLGVNVLVEPGARLTGPDGKAFVPALGQRVAVSGLWHGDGVAADRIDLLADSQGPVVVGGEIKAGKAPGALRLGALNLTLPRGTAAPPVGSFVTAVGRRLGTALLAEQVTLGRFQGTAGPLKHLSVEGYLEPIAAAPGYAISGFGHSFDRGAQLAALASDRALFIGPYDGDFRVEVGVPLPEAIAERQDLLEAMDEGLAPEVGISTR